MNTLKHISSVHANPSRWQLELGGEVIAYLEVTDYDFPFTTARLVDSPRFARFRPYFTDPASWPEDDASLDALCTEVTARGRFVLRELATGIAYQGVNLHHDGQAAVWFRHGDPVGT